MSFTIRQATEEDGPGICRLFSRNFPRNLTLGEWQWKYPGNPDGWVSVVAEVGGEIAGHFGGWPARILIGGEETTIFSGGDVVTDRAHRQLGGRRNIFRSMAEEWFDLLRPRTVAFGFGFPSPRALEVGQRFLGYREHFPVRELRFELGEVGSGPDDGADFAGPSFDPLWDAARPLVAESGLVRDRARVNWRYHARPDRYYRMVCVEEPVGRSLAWGVLSVLGSDALVMDYLTIDASPETFEKLWNALRSEAARLAATTLVFWEPRGGPWRSLLFDKLGPRGAGAVDAGFSFVTPVVFDEEALARCLRSLHFTPAFYDDR